MTYRYRNRAILDLPLLAADHDPANSKTLNRGRGGSTLDADFGAGAREPTKLTSRGYSFDGSDTLICSPDAEGYANTTGKVSAFVSCRLDDASDFRAPISWEVTGDTTTMNALILYTNIGPDLRFYSGPTGLVILSPDLIPEGKVQSLGVTNDGSVMVAYVNGVEVGRDSTPGVMTSDPQPMHVGARTDTGGNGFAGEIYKAEIYDFALDPTQALDWHHQAMAHLRWV